VDPPSKALKQNIARALILRMVSTDTGQSVALTGGLLGLLRIGLIKHYDGEIPEEIDEAFEAMLIELHAASQSLATGEFWPDSQSQCLRVFIDLCEIAARHDLLADDSLSVSLSDFVNAGGQLAGMEQGDSIAAQGEQ